ncbi:glycosyltransferase [Natrialbaceae archaeon A-CW3]
MERNHCALFLPSLPVGGAERMMINIATGLADRGHDVDLVLVKAEGAFLDDVSDDVSIIDLTSSRVLTSVFPLIKYLQKEEPDVLLSTITPTNVVAVWATLFPGISTKHVVRVARPESEAAEVQENTFKERVTAGLARFFYPFADEIVAISQGVADDVRANTRLSSEDIHVIYNPVVTPKLIEKSREPVDHPWFDDGEPVILGVGRLVDQKDFATLLKAFEIVTRNRQANLVIFGDGNLRDELENLAVELEIDSDVDLPGFTDNPYKYMANSDVFVNSAKHEGFGNVIIEAMACGAPLVATDCPGAPGELLGDGEFGSLVPVGDPEVMASEIEEMVDNPTSCKKLYDRADNFSIDSAIELYEKLL